MTDDSGGTLGRLKRPLRYLLSLVFVGAGVMHFVSPKAFARIVPPRFPRPLLLVYLSGITEILLSLGVLVRRTRQLSCWGLIALLLAVFPANVHMAKEGMVPPAVPDRAEGIARLALWARLPFQGVLVLWAWWYTRAPPGNAD